MTGRTIRVSHANALGRCSAALLVGTLGGLVGCSSSPSDQPAGFAVDEPPPETLEQTKLLEWTGSGFEYADGVVPYELNSALFSDYARKDRAIWLPEGLSATYQDNDVFDFPVGTVILKSFSFPQDLRVPNEDVRLIETRVLAHDSDGWKTYPYVWNEDGTSAALQIEGASLEISFLDYDGNERTANYLVPQKNQCLSCHELKGSGGGRYTTPIGPKARHLNREAIDGTGDNQLVAMTNAGRLSGMPSIDQVDVAFDFQTLDQTPPDQLSPALLDEAARDYLDINCAHCHNPNGVNGISSQLFLNHDNEDTFHLGVCKQPGSAGKGNGGLTYDIVPGAPDESILLYRMVTDEVGSMMPLIGRSIEHLEGTDLVRAWIADMDPIPCE